MAAFSDVIASLGEQFGALDNQTEKWRGQDQHLTACFPQIRAALQEHFPPGSAPLAIFEQAAQRYRKLLNGLEAPARGYLNLRFYIMLNGFLAACTESLEKAGLNESLDPSTLVTKSYYTPFFFERAALTTEEVRQMLAADIEQLNQISRDKRGMLQAERIRKGIISLLAESYCPNYPALYPLVAELENRQVRHDPALIDDLTRSLSTVYAALESRG